MTANAEDLSSFTRLTTHIASENSQQHSHFKNNWALLPSLPPCLPFLPTLHKKYCKFCIQCSPPLNLSSSWLTHPCTGHTGKYHCVCQQLQVSSKVKHKSFNVVIPKFQLPTSKSTQRLEQKCSWQHCPVTSYNGHSPVTTTAKGISQR